MAFRPGDVLRVRWDDRPLRVLMSDAAETFYDMFIPGVGWNLQRARTADYDRASTSILRSTAERLGSDPLTPEEVKRHRPDLPLRLFRSAEAGTEPRGRWRFPDDDFEIAAPRLALTPCGAMASAPTRVAVKASNGVSFSGAELLRAAQQLGTASHSDRGLGLVRRGVAGGVPSYYIGGTVELRGYAR